MVDSSHCNSDRKPIVILWVSYSRVNPDPAIYESTHRDHLRAQPDKNGNSSPLVRPDCASAAPSSASPNAQCLAVQALRQRLPQQAPERMQPDPGVCPTVQQPAAQPDPAPQGPEHVPDTGCREHPFGTRSKRSLAALRQCAPAGRRSDSQSVPRSSSRAAIRSASRACRPSSAERRRYRTHRLPTSSTLMEAAG